MTLLQHRNGGTITALTHAAHATHDGVADWFYIGTVEYADGTKNVDLEIGPNHLCHDGEGDASAMARKLNTELTAYLCDVGVWHEPKHKPDGRVYSWTPNEPNGRRELVTKYAETIGEAMGDTPAPVAETHVELDPPDNNHKAQCFLVINAKAGAWSKRDGDLNAAIKDCREESGARGRGKQTYVVYAFSCPAAEVRVYASVDLTWTFPIGQHSMRFEITA